MSGLGARGEDIAAVYLRRQGCRILQRNFRHRCGEIDIIARDKDTLCFVEVKTRKAEDPAGALEAVSRFKQQRLIRAARIYLQGASAGESFARFDVIAVTLNGQGPGRVQWVQNAFEVPGP